MSAKFQTLHPDAEKQGVNIDAGKYHAVRQAILDLLAAGPCGFRDMVHKLEEDLEGQFDGSVPWYVTSVKLDLEARGMIERVPQVSPQQLRLVKGGLRDDD